MSDAPFTTSLSTEALADYVARQMNAFFPDGDEGDAVEDVLGDALGRMEHCVRHVRMKGWWKDGNPRFNHLHTDQYAVFLYFLANAAYRRDVESVAAKAYALNKALHGLDAFYEVELPGIFALVHPVGTVLGRATYGDYFCAYQNVTVGSDLDNRHPVIGSGVVLYGGSRVIGDGRIGNNCLISAGCSLLGDSLPDNHIALGQHPAVTAKPNRRNVIGDIFQDV
ncbi:MAG: serine acetyltransferase [Rhodospirillaceae bacterium]|nr:MAG: serine acetyltransferase [Rhodospirillaceae bacterium]